MIKVHAIIMSTMKRMGFYDVLLISVPELVVPRPLFTRFLMLLSGHREHLSP